MTQPLSDVERRLAETLREVAGQTTAPAGGFERLRADLDRPGRTDRSQRPRYGRLVATAAAVALTLGGGAWAVVTLSQSNQATSADFGPADLVRVPDLTPATAPLYLLPPEGTDLSGEVRYWDEPVVDEGTGLIIGRLTVTGIHDVVLVAHLTSGPTFGEYEGSVVQIAGRELRQPDDADGTDGVWVAAEKLADGTWIEYTTTASGDVLAQAVAGTIVVDGQLQLDAEAGGLQELGRIGDLQGSQQTTLTSLADEGPPSSSRFVLTTTSYDPELGLAVAGLYGQAEQTTVDGRPGFLSRDIGPAGRMLTWATSSGHVVQLIGYMMTEDELRTFAAGLRTVDRQTWEAELAPHGPPTDG